MRARTPRRRLLALTAAGALLPHTVQAGPDDAHFTHARLGFDGPVPAERWCPLLVTIQPGVKAQPLEITVAYDQDPTQRAVVSTRVTTTPGQPLTVPLMLCPPDGLGSVTATLWRNGAPIDQLVWTRAGGPRELPLPDQARAGGIIVGALDIHLRPRVLGRWNDASGARSSTGAGLERASLAQVQPDGLAQTWAGLDGLNCLVARQRTLDTLPPAALDAVAAWVSGGGRLVLVLDSPGPTWRRFAPPGLHASDLAPTPPPTSLGTELAERAVPARAVNARAVTLEPAAAARGWRADHPLPGTNRARSLVAWGPVGGGIVVVVAADPALLTEELNDDWTVPFWTSLLARAMPDQAPPTASNNQPYAYYGYTLSSGDGPDAAGALKSAIDTLCDIPPIPNAVYWLIIVLAAALALAVSLVDFLVLGKFKSRQRSWLSASIWIGACAALAWVLPNVLRRGETSLGRVVVTDILPSPAGKPAVWRSGLTAFFAASSGDLDLRPAAADRPTPAAAATGEQLSGYWRGVSVLEIYPYDRRSARPTASDLPLLQRVSALDGSEAAVTPPPPPGGVPARQWTLRTLQDRGPGERAIGIHVTGGTGLGGLTVTGLPAGSVFKSGAVHMNHGWAPLTLQQGEPAPGLRLSIEPVFSNTLPGWNPAPIASQQTGYYNPYTSAPVPAADGAAYLRLDGARNRTAAFDALVAGGEYMVAHLLVEAPADVTVSSPHRSRALYLYRVAVPLSEMRPAEPTGAPSSDPSGTDPRPPHP